MLSVLLSQDVKPEAEAIDRDPGIISLVSAIVRSVRRGGARVRGARPVVDELKLFSSPTAWPYNGR